MIKVNIGSKIEVTDDSPGVFSTELTPIYNWCENNLVIQNPMWVQLMKLGKEDTIKYKHVPEKLYLYVQKGKSLILPFGCLYGIWDFIKNGEINLKFNVSSPLGIQNCELPIELYEYQKKAVEVMVRAKGGILVAPCGAGKGLPLNTKVYTPTGWKYNGELQVGDKIIGSNGKATTVTHIFDRGLVEAYKIYFSDETSQECDKDHLWNVQSQDDRTNNRKFKTMSTEEIYNYYQKIKTRGKELFIPIVEPVEFEKKEVNIDPWLLGILLSDGNIAKHNIMVSNSESDILERIEKIIGSKLKKDANRLNYNIRDNATTLNKLRQLKLDGVLSYNKFIPKEFLYNDIETRLSLLQGLFDGDGTVGKKRCNYEYSTSSKQLAEDVVELIQSLGGTAKIKQKIPTYTYKGEKKIGKISYRVFFKLYKYKPFSSQKHYSKFSERTNYKKAYRKIVKIERICPIQSRCIKVEASDSLYVIQNFIVTHNTIMGIEMIHRLNRKFLWLTHTKDLLNQALDDMKQLFPNIDVGLITEGKVEIGRDGAIATIQTLVNIDPELYADQFEVVMCDECFPGNTLISTPNGKKELKNLKNGDIVYSYNRKGELEEKPITHLFKLKPHDLYEINICNGKKLICTGNHPIYTKRGYIPAKEITKDDYVLQMVSETIRHKDTSYDNSFEKREKGLGTLFNTVCSFDSQSKKSPKHHSRNEEKMESKYDKIKQGPRDDKQKKGEAAFRTAQGENKCYIQKNGLQFFDSRGKWYGYTKTSNAFIYELGSKEIKLFSRVSDSYWGLEWKFSKPSNLLQGGYCNTRLHDLYRSGWFKPFESKKATRRQKEGRVFEWKRVESIEIQKQTDNGTYGGLCEDGYVYNIEVKDNNNYFAEDILVHNCHHVCGSPTISKMFSKVITKIPARYKYGLTATPERSDTMIKTMYTLIGMSRNADFEPTYAIDRSEINTMEAEHVKYDITLDYGYEILNSDGTLDYNTLIDYLSDHDKRNEIIVNNIVEAGKQNRKQVVLCHRVRHVEHLYNLLLEKGLRVKMVVGKVSNKKRKEILENCENWDVMVATYSLLKEGISIKALDTLHLTTPQKNKSMIVQCAGRIERFLEGKQTPVIYDYVDVNVPYCVGAYRKRKSSLKNRF